MVLHNATPGVSPRADPNGDTGPRRRHAASTAILTPPATSPEAAHPAWRIGHAGFRPLCNMLNPDRLNALGLTAGVDNVGV